MRTQFTPRRDDHRFMKLLACHRCRCIRGKWTGRSAEGIEDWTTLTYANEYLIKILITPASNGVSPSTDSHDAVYKIVNIIIYISVTRDR